MWRREGGAQSTIIRSRDGGKNWEQLERGLGEASKDFSDVIVVDDLQPERVYAAQRNGDFYFSEDAGDSWAKLDLKVPGVAAMQLIHAEKAAIDEAQSQAQPSERSGRPR
jgi:photosystem II stability/assembly factor-like uncharacterized protein